MTQSQIPPNRIVTKVDELMDRLEVGLSTAANTRRRLFDALLAEAPEGVRPRARRRAESSTGASATGSGAET